MKKMKGSKGITLIALVITIIVLLILAGVTINAIMGENGVANKAKDAKIQTVIGREKESLSVAYSACQAENLLEGDVTKEQLKKELENLNENVEVSVSESNLLVRYLDTNNLYKITQNGDIEDVIGTDDDSDDSGTVMELKWIYSENEDGDIEITGADLSEYTLTRPEKYSRAISLGTDIILEIPEKIDGKTVVKFDWVDSIFTIGDDYSLAIGGVKKIVYADTITEISNTYPNKDIVFPDVTEIHLPENLIVLGDWACTGYSSLESLQIPSLVTTIGIKAFRNCSSLKSIVIPDSVTTIGEKAFYYCDKLQNVTLSNSITELGKETFYYCQGLTNIVIPSGVEVLGEKLFSNCWNLETITIPKTVISMGDEAFLSCGSLSTVNYEGTEEEWNQISFGANCFTYLTNVEYNYTY